MQKMFEWRTGRSCYYKLLYHLVFVTKYRKGVLGEKMLQRLEEVYKETCEQMGGELLAFGGEEDHVHLMVSVPPKTAVSNLIGKIERQIFVRAEKRIRERTEWEAVGQTLVESELLCGLFGWRCARSGEGLHRATTNTSLSQSHPALRTSTTATPHKKSKGGANPPLKERDCAPYESVQATESSG